MKKIALLIVFAFTISTLQAQASKKSVTSNKGAITKYSEEKALELIDDYFLFYNAEYKYRYAKVRRVSNNVFYISLEECSKDFADKSDFFWRSIVYVLTIKSNSKYTVKPK